MTSAPDPADEHAPIPEHPLTEGLLGRPPGRSRAFGEGCKKHPHRRDGLRYPWAGDDRAGEKTRIFRYVHNSPGGVPLSKIVRDVFDGSGEYDQADYQLTRRFVQKSDLFDVRRCRGLLWCSQSLKGLSLTLSMQSARTREGSGAGGSPSESGVRSPGDTARARLNRLPWLERDVRGDLLRDLASKREGNAGRYLTFKRRAQHTAPESPEHLLVPLETRFSSGERAREQYQGYQEAWDRAASTHDRGVVLTITTDPKRHDSVLEAAETLMDDCNRLRSWLAYDPDDGPSRPGYRPDSICVPEFTDSGLPHAHIAFFGVSWLTTADSIRSYLRDGLGRGEQIHLDRITRRNGSWSWVRDPDAPDVAGRSPREYLGEPLEARRQAALATPDELAAASEAIATHGLDSPISSLELGPTAESDLRLGRRAWKAALYWATGLRFYTRSPSLRAPSEGLPHAPKWSLECIATWDQLPRQVVGDADVIPTSPPPPALRMPGTGPRGSDSHADLEDDALGPIPFDRSPETGIADDD